MSLFKKFTDFCAGIAAFAASLQFIIGYMQFTPVKDIGIGTSGNADVTEKIPGKLTQFLNKTTGDDYSMLLPLIFILIFSAVLGRVFKRLPYVCFGISLFPAMTIAFAYETKSLRGQVGLYLILGALHVLGNLYECIARDKEDGKHRMWIAAKVSSAMGAFVCFFVMWKGAQTPPADMKEINRFEKMIFFEMTKSDVDVLTKLGVMFVVLLIVSIVIYNVYFIDAILSFIPAGFAIYRTAGGFLTFAPAVFGTLAAVCAVSHLLLCVFENNLSAKEQKALKEKT